MNLIVHFNQQLSLEDIKRLVEKDQYNEKEFLVFIIDLIHQAKSNSFYIQKNLFILEHIFNLLMNKENRGYDLSLFKHPDVLFQLTISLARVPVFRSLLKYTGGINVIDSFGFSPLAYAVMNYNEVNTHKVVGWVVHGALNLISDLIHAGADANLIVTPKSLDYEEHESNKNLMVELDETIKTFSCSQPNTIGFYQLFCYKTAYLTILPEYAPSGSLKIADLSQHEEVQQLLKASAQEN